MYIQLFNPTISSFTSSLFLQSSTQITCMKIPLNIKITTDYDSFELGLMNSGYNKRAVRNRYIITLVINSNILLIKQKYKRMSDKGKPYMIQLYAPDQSLLNKYKFVIVAKTVAELKNKVVQKLQSKNQLDKDHQITIKDINDFQLGSDDEVDDVIPDCKIRVYLSKSQSLISVPLSQSPQQNPSSNNIQIAIPPANSLIVQNSPLTNIAVNVPIIDIANLKIPQLPIGYENSQTLKIICPQIRKTQFFLQSQKNISFYELSKYIVKSLNLNESLKAIIYSNLGQPLLFNLDLIHMEVPKLDLSSTFYVIFTSTVSASADNIGEDPVQITDNKVLVKLEQGKQKYQFQVDLSNNLSVLKYKIFKKLAIPPLNQIIKFANNALVNDIQILNAYGIKEGSILTLQFKTISNIMPSTYADKFFYKDVQMIHPQQNEVYRLFKSNILAFGFHLSETDKIKLISFVRFSTLNEPFVCALSTLLNGAFLSQAHRIALQQGFYASLWSYAKSCQPEPQTDKPFLLNHTRHYIGYLLESIERSSNSDLQFAERQEIIILNKTCQLTTKEIKLPGLIKLDDGKIALVDKNEFSEQIDKGYTFPLLKEPRKQKIFQNQSLLENFEILNYNSLYSPSPLSIVVWLGKNHKSMTFDVVKIEQIEKYQHKIVSKYNNLKVHMPLEIKNKSSIYLLLLNKENEYRVFVSKNKDINKPHNIFDVISGKEQSVNLDLLSAAGKTENLQEVVDIKDLKPVITRQPKQAIVVLFDISGSMGGRFFNQPDLKRIGSCKLFFQALAYRTIAYSFEHVVSLTFFDHQINIQLDFTEAIYDFNRLVSAANSRGSTKLYDAIVSGVNQLKQFKKRYPDCILRILALTDGEDTCSKYSIFDATKEVVKNGIIMDSFAVGTNCQGLKSITFASGGKCYLTRSMQQSLKLFEQQTVLSVRSRKMQTITVPQSDDDILSFIQKAKLKPFDLPNNVHQFKMPQIKSTVLSKEQIEKKYNSQEGQKSISGNASLKRIAKEIQNYNKNPHPFVSIFPTQNIKLWKILLMGPKQTPYENGLFLLYAKFPEDYPFRAPEVRFMTTIYHCNMNQQGRICHSVFDRNYSPAITFKHIVDSIYGLILTPQPDDPLDNVIASFFLSDYPKYLSNAKQATLKNASKSPQQLVEQIFGKIADDIERQKKIQQIGEWIESAKASN